LPIASSNVPSCRFAAIPQRRRAARSESRYRACFDDAAEQIAIDRDDDVRGHVDVDAQLADLEVRAIPRARAIDELDELHRLRHRAQHAVLELVDVEDRRHQAERLAEQELGVIEVRLQLRGHALGSDLFEHQLQIALHGRERRAQIVNDERGQHAALLAQLARAVFRAPVFDERLGQPFTWLRPASFAANR